MPPSDPPSVGSPDHVLIDFPLDGWSFHATFQPAGQRCGRSRPFVFIGPSKDPSSCAPQACRHLRRDIVRARQRRPRHRISVVHAIRRATPGAEVAAGLLAGHDGQLDSYGVELEASHLAKTPAAATAKITATAANGESTTFEATRSRQRCQPDGTLYRDGPRRPRVGRCSPWPGSLHIQSGAEPRRQAPRGYGRLARRRDQGKRTLGHAQLHSRPPGTRVKRDPGTTAAISGNTPVRKRRS